MISTIKITRTSILILIPVLLFASCKKPTLPSLSTIPVTSILQTSAYSGGYINSDGNAQITARGVCWNTSVDPATTNSKTSDTTSTAFFISHITGLTPHTIYYLRAYATNSEGTAYGDQVSFTTYEVSVPTVTTKAPKSLTLTSATSGGNIINDGGIAVTGRGVCWNTTGSPTITDSYSSDGSGAGLFVSTMSDLTIGTTYYIRAYGTNSLGTGYGDELVFTQTEPVLDKDGNPYSVVTIGTQIWLGENLQTSTFMDGVSIPYVSAGRDWDFTNSPAFCWYDNNETAYKSKYGALYNWYAVNSGKLCPDGWHVPSATEFTTLITYLGGESIAGGKLKEAGTEHWAEPNAGATNVSGFTALPGGGRYNIHSESGAFADIGYGCYIWSATEGTIADSGYSFDVVFNLAACTRNEYSRNDGGAVRCIKDAR
jgi:uncharacterized protein (TIGR02145 family)